MLRAGRLHNSASTSSSPNKNANAFSGKTIQTLDHTNTKMCTKLYRSLCEMYSQGERGSGDIQCPAVCGTQIAPR